MCVCVVGVVGEMNLLEPIRGSSGSRLDVLCDISCLMVGRR